MKHQRSLNLMNEASNYKFVTKNWTLDIVNEMQIIL